MGKKIYPALWHWNRSRTELHVLAVLTRMFDEQGPGALFSVYQLSRWTGLGRRAVRRVMLRMERAGVIRRYSGGR